MGRLGNKTKISSLTGAHEYNTDFDNLISDASHGRLKIDQITDFDRPAYYGTSACRAQGSSQYDGRRLYAKDSERDN